MPLERFHTGPPRAVEKLNAIIDALQQGVVIENGHFAVETQPNGRLMLTPKKGVGAPGGTELTTEQIDTIVEAVLARLGTITVDLCVSGVPGTATLLTPPP